MSLTHDRPQATRLLSSHRGYVGQKVHVFPSQVTDGLTFDVSKDKGAFHFTGTSINILFHPVDAHGHGNGESDSKVFAKGMDYFFNLTSSCTTKDTSGVLEITVSESNPGFSCYSLMLSTSKYQSSYIVRLLGDAVEAAGIELYAWAIYRPEEDHSGHDHGRLLQESSHNKALVEAFNIKSASTGEALNPEIIFVDGEVYDPDSLPPPEDGAELLAFFSCFLVLLVTLIGIVFTIPAVELLARRKNRDAKIEDVEKADTAENHAGNHDFEVLEDLFRPEALAYSQAFAAGAILSTAFLLVLPEATGMIWNDIGRDMELEATTWKWGTCILSGIIFPFVLSLGFSLVSSYSSEESRVVSGIIVGDFFHNITDGTFIAAAFMSCNISFGWAVALSSIIHELAQEIADYLILTTVVGYSPGKALFLNFISGTR